ncbi:sensor domain-containing diguanylate cyclase [Pseudomonas alkylphenolica]|uniref:diguanylate cyclase n=1 Tax=Pseudomonas alkylphenolica TaxID=237609 RepID=A0A443ZJP7_9PSED|nr:sensor domain-containing diguanylate cyclase [Pseudomonas alkylphenolica]RWU19152.1 sensor domain-containing diguanylate cyclase [Pseudomonas alkylphenolica]
MKKFAPASISLRGLILIFVLLAVIATLCNSLFVAYEVQRDALIKSALEANRAYAFKVASGIDEFLRSVDERLGYSSKVLGNQLNDPQVLKDEVKRLQAQDTELNSVMVIDATGKALQIYPEQPLITGTHIDSNEVQEALKAQRPLVSHAYETATGNLIVFISHPVLSPSGQYLGLIGGSIFIKQRGVLHTLIASHALLDGTYAFVADDNRRLLYHWDQHRIGDVLPFSPTVDAALQGERGTMEAANYKGVDMLAGYAQVERARWAVVTQQPREQALSPLGTLMRNMLVNIVPAGLIGLILIFWGATLITRPLRHLANSATQLSAPEATERLGSVNAWYAEAAAIRSALLNSVQLLQQKLGRLRRAAESDALTGLANRRAMDEGLRTLDQSGQHYCALALDIDRFKRVNDTYGHDVGDLVLKQVASIIQEHSRAEDLACRAGGEEFTLLLPDISLATAGEVAERIRLAIATAVFEQIESLTISIGVACRSDETPTPEAILKHADELLYQAKQTGRNRVVVQTLAVDAID